MPYQELTKGRISLPWQIYHVTTVTEGRQPWFKELFVARFVIHEMKRMHDREDIYSHAWVLMPDHLHWLFQLNEKSVLPAIMQEFKGRSARAVNLFLGRKGSLWQRAYYDHAIRNDEDIQQMARYIVANPLRRGLVEKIGDYSHWDAIWM